MTSILDPEILRRFRYICHRWADLDVTDIAFLESVDPLAMTETQEARVNAIWRDLLASVAGGKAKVPMVSS